MTDGTSQGLFIVVAIVIFGIFVVMVYILFEDTLSPALASMFSDATEQTSDRIDIAKHYHISTVTPTDDSMFEFKNGVILNYLGTIRDVVIPYEIDGKKVVGIGNNAFNDKNLSSVIIPNTVETIGSNAFISNKIKSLYLPDSIKSLGGESFEDNLITELRIGKGLTEISSESFRFNKLTKVEIPSNIKAIKGYAFSYNPIVEFTVPKTVNDLGHFFIGGNSNYLKKLSIPKDFIPKIEALPSIISRNAGQYIDMTPEERNEQYDSSIIEYY